jgi:hypothetical protein
MVAVHEVPVSTLAARAGAGTSLCVLSSISQMFCPAAVGFRSVQRIACLVNMGLSCIQPVWLSCWKRAAMFVRYLCTVASGCVPCSLLTLCTALAHYAACLVLPVLHAVCSSASAALLPSKSRRRVEHAVRIVMQRVPWHYQTSVNVCQVLV